MNQARPYKQINRRRSAWRRALVIGLLVTIIGTGAPVPAHANIMWDIPTLAATVYGWAVKFAKMAAEEAQELLNEYASSIQSAIPVVLDKLDSDVNTSLSQAAADNGKRTLSAKVAGDSAEDSLYSTQGQVCALTHAGQEVGMVNAITKQAVSKLAAQSASRGTGTKADVSSPAYAAVEVNDLCKLGFLDTNATGRYGKVPQSMGCTTLTGADAHYVDADLRLSSVLGSLQYPLPAPGHANPNANDGHLSFIGSTATETATGLGSELDYAAAYKFCEHLQPDAATPTHNGGNPTAGDIASMNAFATTSALRTSAAEQCFKSLAYRTSCPPGSSGSLAAGSSTCAETQKQLCARLTNSHAQGGLELTMQGDNPIYAAALAHCDTDGISPAMYDAIMAHRCHDRNYAFRVLPTTLGRGPALEHAHVFECPAMEAAYEYKMGVEREKFISAMEGLIVLRKTTSMSNGQPSREVP